MRAKRLALLGVVAAGLVAAAPAQAINDPQVPGNECSNFHSVAVGDPDPFGFGNPGINGPSPVDPPASLNNPSGVSPGAQGQEMSRALGNCHNFQN
jgi:hypothetical protein